MNECPLKAPVSSNIFVTLNFLLRQQFSQGVNTKDIDCSAASKPVLPAYKCTLTGKKL